MFRLQSFAPFAVGKSVLCAHTYTARSEQLLRQTPNKRNRHACSCPVCCPSHTVPRDWPHQCVGTPGYARKSIPVQTNRDSALPLAGLSSGTVLGARGAVSIFASMSSVWIDRPEVAECSRNGRCLAFQTHARGNFGGKQHRHPNSCFSACVVCSKFGAMLQLASSEDAKLRPDGRRTSTLPGHCFSPRAHVGRPAHHHHHPSS